MNGGVNISAPKPKRDKERREREKLFRDPSGSRDAKRQGVRGGG